MVEATPDQTIPTDRQTFVIGDVHGRLNCLKALLEKAEVKPDDGHTVIQLGDLGHYGQTGNAAHDFETWLYAQDHIDYVLWGNHDYAVVNNGHVFGGYVQPYPETYRLMRKMQDAGRIRFAMEAHGFLLTHAGLGKFWKVAHVDLALKINPRAFVAWVKQCSEEQDPPYPFKEARDSISGYRGGGSDHGGFLWRDAREKLYPEFRQIFGHTAKDGSVRKYHSDDGYSYCIDTGTATNGKLAGIWLPSEEIIDIQI